MKVAYLDLCIPLFEDYALKPKRYGGGRIFVSLLKQHPWFDVFCAKECVINFTSEDRASSFHEFPLEKRKLAEQGAPLISLLPELADYDIIFTCYTNVKFNMQGLKAKLVVWSVGFSEDIHEDNEHLFLYNDYQHPRIKGSKTKVYKFTLGKDIKPLVQREKSDYIFQCTRHCHEFCSIDVARTCRAAGIKAYFAGPIVNDYPLLNEIDNYHTFYLGQIDEETKMHFTERARLYTMIHNWPTPFNLSAIEALSVGTPIVATPVGFWPSLIKPEFNGFFASTTADIIYAYENANKISQASCYSSASPFNNSSMNYSIIKGLESVMLS
jgi:hypothetical protein